MKKRDRKKTNKLEWDSSETSKKNLSETSVILERPKSEVV